MQTVGGKDQTNPAVYKFHPAAQGCEIGLGAKPIMRRKCRYPRTRYWVLSAKALTTLGTTALDNGTAGTRSHASTKTMVACAANSTGFKRKTHGLLLKRVANSKVASTPVKPIMMNASRTSDIIIIYALMTLVAYFVFYGR